MSQSETPFAQVVRAERSPEKKKPLWMDLLKWGLLASVLVVIYVVFHKAAADPNTPWDRLREKWEWVAAAAGAFACLSVIMVVIRRLLLAGFCQPPGWRAMAAVSWIPLIGKYIPGKIFSVAGTLFYLRKYKVREDISASLLLITNGLSLTAGFLIAMKLTFWQPVVDAWPMARLFGIALGALMLVALWPSVFKAVLRIILQKLKRPPLQTMPALKDYAIPFILMCVNWGLTGTALWLIAHVANGTPMSDGGLLVNVTVAQWPLFVAGASLAASIGLLAVFAPAGLGVREGIQLLILTPLMGKGNALVVALSMRLTQTSVELLTVLAGTIVDATIHGNEQDAPTPPILVAGGAGGFAIMPPAQQPIAATAKPADGQVIAAADLAAPKQQG